MTCVELDGELLNLAKTWFTLQEDDQIKYVTADGLGYMEKQAVECKFFCS